MTPLRLPRIDLASLSPVERRELLTRRVVPDPEIRERAAAIVADVRRGGDSALSRLNELYGGGAATGELGVPPADLAGAASRLSARTREALERAMDAIAVCHRAQLPAGETVEPVPGVRIERVWSPLRSVGVYVPGGRASYPSSLLMGVVPARVAGVPDVFVATPAGPDGRVADVVLAAANIAGADAVYVMGGAQAIGALAFGTETIPRVDKIVGPGNAWVTAAKLEVFGDVAIDLPAGPSEALVLDDGTTDPRLVAVDMMCQAEHGDDSPVVLVTTAPAAVQQIVREIGRMLPHLERSSVIEKALSDHGMAVVAPSLDDAVEFANEYGAEHVTVHVADAAATAARIENAGSVFVGEWAPESAGDYASGANHVLPTGGQARAHGPLGVADFGSWRQVQHISRPGLEALRPTITALAEAEGLTAHRLAVEARFTTEPGR